LVKDIAKVLKQPIEEIAFVLGDPAFFGEDVVSSLTALANELGARASIYRQDEPLGTGHAIMSAEPSLTGPAVIAYADTLIRAAFDLDPEADSVIWTKKVANPEAYGVVQLNADQHIVELVEKPQEFVSDQAVIGIYYFKEVSQLREKLQEVLKENIMNGGEYQINDGIKRMMADGRIFKTGTVDEWMDCGNKTVTLETNAKMLEFIHADGDETMIHPSVQLVNSKIIEPCVIGANTQLENCTIGPHVSIGSHCHFIDAQVKNSLIQNNSSIKNANLEQAMIGNHVRYNGHFTKISIGDYSQLD
jgi:glucose-1-phosphate thymidylyltransferase